MKLLSSGRCRGSAIHSPPVDVENVSDEVLGAFRAATNPTTAEVDKFKYMANRLEPRAGEVFQQTIDMLQVDTSFPADGNFLLVVKVFFNKMGITSKMCDNILLLRYLEIGIKKPRDLTNSHVHVSEADAHLNIKSISRPHWNY